MNLNGDSQRLTRARPGALAATAEIFCAVTEAELWECVQDLREHHLRDLYRSVTA